MVRTDRDFSIIPMSLQGTIFVIIICLGIAAAFIAPFFLEPFSLAAIIISGIVCSVVGILIGSLGYQAKKATFSITDRSLVIKPGIYGRTIPKEDIVIDGVRIINLNNESNYKPKWRTNGAGLIGYLAGWFSLHNGERALLFLTDRSSVVYIPTKNNYSVLLSVKEADLMLEQLQNWN
ncbi:MAG: PH domain-containing protein [Dehalococcoidales bacterium]|nr:PH domain-containing protein [Dehalococcoidales bacterium]